jgi:hypothetical protein
LDSLISFEHFRPKAQRVIREAKQTSWKAFISSLSRSTRPDVVWDRLRRMSGKYSRTIVPGLSAFLTSQADIANTIASSFSTVCSSVNYNPDFRAIKNSAEIFTMDKLLAALDRSRNTSPVPDVIHNEMLSHQPLADKELLLSVYNCIWT